MNNYVMTLLKKDLERKVDKLESVGWWTRTVEGLVRDSKEYNEKDLEAFRQKLQAFKEEKERLKEDAASLRAAMTKLHSVTGYKRGKLRRRTL